MSDTPNEALPLRPALGPGDDDPASPPKGAASALAPAPGPGDGAPATHRTIVISAPGPGDDAVAPRSLTQVPIEKE